jgi:hypothetical protein
MNITPQAFAEECRRLYHDDVLNMVLEALKAEAQQEFTEVDASDPIAVLRLQERAKMPEEILQRFKDAFDLEDIAKSAE